MAVVQQKHNKKKIEKKKQVGIVHPDAAGIDLGSRSHYVAVGHDKSKNPVRNFGCCTPDLEAMAHWLKECHVTTVAMESTGVYWVPVFQVLEKHGFEVVLVNTHHFKCVPGRKSDVQDCQWIQHLHECGLLRGSFRPQDAIVVLRTYVRQRDTLIAESSRHIQRMQKALEQMNIQLHKVLSDITGESGMAIIKAIVAGERNAETMAQMCNYRVRSSRDEIVAALTGDYRPEHLFCLKQELEMYEHIQNAVASCQKAMENHWAQFQSKNDATQSLIPAAKNKKQDVALRHELYRVAGVDLTAIDSMSPASVMQIISEVGLDMSRWPSEKHFASWLHLSPNNRITGGRIHSGRTQPSTNRAAAVLRKCAENLARSQSYLGAFYRRKRAQKGGPHAVTATAHKLAKIFYRMLRYGKSYVDLGSEHYEKVNRTRQLNAAITRIKALGYDLTLQQNQAVP